MNANPLYAGAACEIYHWLCFELRVINEKRLPADFQYLSEIRRK
jgi:hypothetical protein